jgi:cell division initiation protein
MDISAIDIQNKQFKVKFRGFDIHEVDLFLEEMSDTFESMQTQIKLLEKEINRLTKENKGHKEREETLKTTLIHSQKVMEQMKENARKSSDIIIAGAEVKAEKILNNAHNRLSQLHVDIAELKRQRMQIEIQISSVLESHTKLLKMGKAERNERDVADAKVKLLKQIKP